jgi:hypothetical protein
LVLMSLWPAWVGRISHQGQSVSTIICATQGATVRAQAQRLIARNSCPSLNTIPKRSRNDTYERSNQKIDNILQQYCWSKTFGVIEKCKIFQLINNNKWFKKLPICTLLYVLTCKVRSVFFSELLNYCSVLMVTFRSFRTYLVRRNSFQETVNWKRNKPYVITFHNLQTEGHLILSPFLKSFARCRIIFTLKSTGLLIIILAQKPFSSDPFHPISSQITPKFSLYVTSWPVFPFIPLFFFFLFIIL